MYCYHGTATNTKGDSLPGYFVECLSGTTVQAIFSDNSSTPILGASGVANRAKVDTRGNFFFYVANGTYDLKYYDTAGVYQFSETNFTMVDGLAVLAVGASATASAATATTQAGIATTQATTATTQASTATTQAGIATTQAGIATTQAGISTTQATAAAASASSASTASQTAPNVYATTAAGIAAVADGATFWVTVTGGIALYRRAGASATLLLSTTDPILVGTSPTQFGLYARGPDVVSYGVPYFRSTATNQPTALDIMPNGTGGVSTDKAWLHVCNSDLSPTSSTNFEAAYVGALPTNMQFGSMAGGTGVVRPIKIFAPVITFYRNKNEADTSMNPMATLTETGLALWNGFAVGYGPSGNGVALGVGALAANVSGGSNTAIGGSALAVNTGGGQNTAVGFSALAGNTTGNYNAAIGNNALQGNTIGLNNVALGASALAANTTGSNNLAIGYQAGQVSTGANQTFIGTNAGSNVTTGAGNTFVGAYAGAGVTTGDNNTIIGLNIPGLTAALSNTILVADGSGLVGVRASPTNTTLGKGISASISGTQNVVIGTNATTGMTTGASNTIIGNQAAGSATSAASNVVVGSAAGFSLTTGGSNVFLGPSAGFGVTTGRANVVIGGVTGLATGLSNTVILADGDGNVRMRFDGAVPILKPPAIATPTNNGEMTFELTSNTSLTIKAKGSDGTVRSVVLTLA